MEQPTHVLAITKDDGLRNLLEQIFHIDGVKMVLAETVSAAEAIINVWGLAAFGLMIIDTAALGANETEQKQEVCRLLEEWIIQHPELAFLILGTVLQKHAVHLIRADKVGVLVKPFRLEELVEQVNELCSRGRGHVPPLPQMPQ
jgi:DNA-binding NtrC family response regulator